MAGKRSTFQNPRVAIIVPSKRLPYLGAALWIQRYGPMQVAQVVREAGYFVRVYNEEIGPRIDPREIALDFDVVGVSAKTCAITRAEAIVRAIKAEARQANRRILAVLGGEHASMALGTHIPAAFDIVLPGEAEQALVDILELFRKGRIDDPKRRPIIPPGKIYQCRAFNHVPDLSIVQGYDATARSWLFRHFPAAWILKHKRLPYIAFQGTRGCPFNCSFCPTPKYLHGRNYRRRDPQSAAAFLARCTGDYKIKRVMFEDPTAAVPFDRAAHAFFRAIAASPVDMRATALVRPDVCKDTRLLALMKAAGVVNLSIGIESLNDATRRSFNKQTARHSLAKSIEVLHRFGFSVTGLFIVGYDSESLDSFEHIQDFIDSTGIEKWRVSPLCQTPEVPNQFLPAHRYFLWSEFDRFNRQVADFTNGEYVFFFPKQMKPSELQTGIAHFHRDASSLKATLRFYLQHRRLHAVGQRIGNNIAQRVIQKSVADTAYIEMLKAVEAPYYRRGRRGWELKEEQLAERYRRLSMN
ncbi:MAG: radical SAM protein [Desulfobacterales bacterium]|nr:radical SAM protein [Desulfobacterales bacterium]